MINFNLHHEDSMLSQFYLKPLVCFNYPTPDILHYCSNKPPHFSFLIQFFIVLDPARSKPRVSGFDRVNFFAKQYIFLMFFLIPNCLLLFLGCIEIFH
jgi:hypothetical protein